MFEHFIIILILLSLSILITLLIKIRRTRIKIAEINFMEEQERRNLIIQFYMTDAGNLLRKRKGIWEVFNTDLKRWTVPSFDIEDIFNALPVSKKEAGAIVKYKLQPES
jgi:hypothetical protein